MSFAFTFKINPVAGSDPDPNVTPPAANRIYPNHDNAKGLSVFCGLAGPAGCTAVITVWYLDSTTNLWWSCGASQTAALSVTTNPVIVPTGASFFIQVGAVVNAPTDLYIQIEDFPTTAFEQTTAPSGGSASAANQTSGAQKTQVVDGSGNVSPSGDTAGRARFVKVTDGTNTSTVKAASTAAAFTDPAAVVELRPGGSFPAKGAATTANSIPVTIASDQATLPTKPATVTVVFSTALEASHVIKGSAGTFYGYSARIDSTAPSATYYVQVIDSATLPADGAVTMVVGAVKVIHVSGTDDYPFVELPEPKAAAAGIVLCLSTTEFTKTISSAYLSITEARCA